MGLLSGIGEGLKDVSNNMARREAMDFQARQDAAQHQRALNLENLRASNQSAANVQRQGWQKERDDIAYTRQQKETEKAQQFVLDKEKRDAERQEEADGKKPFGYFEKRLITTDEYYKLTPEQQAKVDPEKIHEMKEELKIKTDLLTATKEMKQDERDEMAKKYKEFHEKAGTWGADDEAVAYSMRTGLPMELLVGTPEKPVDQGLFEMAFESVKGDKKLQSLPLKSQILISHTYAKVMQSGKDEGTPLVDKTMAKDMAKNLDDPTVLSAFEKLDIQSQQWVLAEAKLVEEGWWNKTKEGYTAISEASDRSPDTGHNSRGIGQYYNNKPKATPNTGLLGQRMNPGAQGE